MVRDTVGPGFPIGVRMAGNDFVDGSTTDETTPEIARVYEAAGADILNVLFVIGAAAVAAPLWIAKDQATGQTTTQFVYVALPTMMAMLIYFRFCIYKAGKVGHFSKWMGWPLIIGYIVFTFVSFAKAVGWFA